MDQRRWKTWKNDTSGFSGFFGRNDNPVNYKPNRHNYKIKVRSERRTGQQAQRLVAGPEVRLALRKKAIGWRFSDRMGLKRATGP